MDERNVNDVTFFKMQREMVHEITAGPLPMIRRILKKILLAPMVVIAAMIMFFEEWLWNRLTAATARIARTRAFRWMDARLASLPSYGALAVFLVPGVMLLPVKIAALYLITHGHAGGGLLIIITAKLIGTAIVAHIFSVCRPTLLKVRWFRRLYEWIIRLKNRLYAAIKAMPAWALAVRWKNAIRSRLPRRGFLARRWKAVSQILRRKFLRKT